MAPPIPIAPIWVLSQSFAKFREKILPAAPQAPKFLEICH
jgi:hypothetical protein